MKYKEFIAQLVESFPEIRDEIMDGDISNNITMQMGAFKRFTQKGIDNKDFLTVEQCFNFISLYFNKVDNRLRNSIGITYLYKLVLIKNSSMEKMLPEELKKIRQDIKERYTSKDEEFEKFLKEVKKGL